MPDVDAVPTATMPPELPLDVIVGNPVPVAVIVGDATPEACNDVAVKEVAVAAPNAGVVRVGEVASTALPEPVTATPETAPVLLDCIICVPDPTSVSTCNEGASTRPVP